MLTRAYSLRDVVGLQMVPTDVLLYPRALVLPGGIVAVGTGSRYADPMVERVRRQAISEAVGIVRAGLLPLRGRPHRRAVPLP